MERGKQEEDRLGGPGPGPPAPVPPLNRASA